MDQLLCASLSHTHYWYEVGILKVPAIRIHRREPGRDGNILSDHRQDGNVAVRGIGDLAR